MTEQEIGEWQARADQHRHEQDARRKDLFLAAHGISESDYLKGSLARMAEQAEQALNAQDDGYDYRVTVKP